MGIGQENGLGPSLWALISTILLNMMVSAGHGVRLHSSLTGHVLHVVGFSFVDNTDLFSAKDPNSTGEDLLEDFQAVLDLWAGALVATGGELSPQKSWC